MNELVATANMWKTSGLPAARALIHVDLRLTKEECDRLKRGFVPQEMEDKWFIFHEDGWAYFHRSWTGYCIYKLQIQSDGRDYVCSEAGVSRDPEQYLSTDLAEDERMLRAILFYRFNIGVKPA